MQITMLYTKRGSEDGLRVQQFVQGVAYDVADTLARSFIRAGDAIETRFTHKLVTKALEHIDLGTAFLNALNQSTKGIL